MSNILYLPFISDNHINGVSFDSCETIDDIYIILSDCMDPLVDLTTYEVEEINLKYDGVYIVDEVVAFLVVDHNIIGTYCEGIVTKVNETKVFL